LQAAKLSANYGFLAMQEDGTIDTITHIQAKVSLIKIPRTKAAQRNSAWAKL